MSKDCRICVYNGPCEGRVRNPLIKDCCIPEEPLRALQRSTLTAQAFVEVTHMYIAKCKSASEYWSSNK